MYIVKHSSTLGVNLTNLKIGRSVVTMHFWKTNLKKCDRGLQFRKQKTYDLHATEIIEILLETFFRLNLARQET